jgi:hypothetical protein
VIVELFGVALSEDEQNLMVHVHAATEAKAFTGIAEVKVGWYERQFEISTLLRSSPDDLSALDARPCAFFERSRDAKLRAPSVPELVAEDTYGFARNLASDWLRGKRPVRRTEQFLIAMLSSEDDEVKTFAKQGLDLLVTALTHRSIAPALKREIGEVVMAIARRHYKPASETDSRHDESP